MKAEVDLHVHTTASDGALTPGEVLEAAASRGLRAVGITDHDTTSGLAEATKVAQAVGVELVPGIELSCEWRDKEIHVLGYWPDYHLDWFQEVLKELRLEREHRVARMVKRLNELGYRVSLNRVRELAGEGAVGRPHVARTLTEAGYFDTMEEAFGRLLAKGAPAYVPREKLTPAEAVRLLLQAKAVPVLAHPGLIGEADIVGELSAEGLRGIEVFYPQHSIDEQDHFRNLAHRWRLVATGGSDFHDPDRACGADLGSFGIPYETLLELKKVKDKIAARGWPLINILGNLVPRLRRLLSEYTGNRI